MVIKKVTDFEFNKYGRVLVNYDCSEIIDKMQNTPLENNVIYEPSIKELEDLKIADEFKIREFGEMPIQIGYCNGKNYLLNAVEYHRTSEINIAATDLILILGLEQDISEKYEYNTSKMEAFLVPKGTAIEVYATTLHYAPCSFHEDGFRCVVILPKGTNFSLENAINKKGEDRLLFARNKWLIAHEESGLEKEGAFIGLKGENLSIKMV